MPTAPRKAQQVAKSAAPRRFVFLLLDRFTMLSFASAIEPLRIANRISGETLYTWKLAGEGGDTVTCSNGASFKLDMGLDEVERDDTVLVCGGIDVQMLGGRVTFQKLDIAAAVIAGLMVAALAVFFQRTRIGRALRAVADSHKAALSVGISLNQIWVVVWFTAGLVALVTGIMWGARSDVSFGLQIIALKALPVLILGGFTSVPGAIVGGLIIGVGEKVGEFYWGPLVGSGIESWLAYLIALAFLLFRPQGLFGDKIIERI